jgi:hypothetical protein
LKASIEKFEYARDRFTVAAFDSLRVIARLIEGDDFLYLLWSDNGITYVGLDALPVLSLDHDPTDPPVAQPMGADRTYPTTLLDGRLDGPLGRAVRTN